MFFEGVDGNEQAVKKNVSISDNFLSAVEIFLKKVFIGANIIEMKIKIECLSFTWTFSVLDLKKLQFFMRLQRVGQNGANSTRNRHFLWTKAFIKALVLVRSLKRVSREMIRTSNLYVTGG